MGSIIQEEKECFVCKTRQGLHKHHVFYGTANREKSEQYGLTVWLCGRHHNMSDEGVHFNKELDDKLKKHAQRKFESTHGNREAFRMIFGKSFI